MNRVFAIKALGALIGVAAAVTMAAACSSGAPNSTSDASAASSNGCPSGNPLFCIAPAADAVGNDAGATLQAFAPPGDPGAGGFVFTISGEVNAVTGYPYPPFDPSQTWMVDGWNWQIEKYIVVVDHITLWTDPNLDPSNQQTHGPIVAQVNGPFVVDLHKGGQIPGAGGGGEQSVAIARLDNQNLNGGAAFDPTTYYAFGFSTVPATYRAVNVNLTSDEAADYAYMVSRGYSVYYYGTATWAGDQTGQSGFGLCSADPEQDLASGNQTCAVASTGSSSDGGVQDDAEAQDGGSGGTCPNPYDFAQLPHSMTFQLGFSTPTNYVNCVNYTASEQASMPIRGVEVSPNSAAIEQLTVHMDHPFWESFEEDTPVHWDQIAAQYIGQANPVAHTEDFVGVPFNPFTDSKGTVLPWHWCETAYTPPGNAAMSFSTLSVPQDPGGVCTGPVGVDFTSSQDDCPGIRDYYDFIRYTQSTQGHLNSQGLCYIDRQFPSPPGGS